MQITLNDKEYTLYFGIRFIRELDKTYYMDEGTIQFGTGVNSAFLKLQNQDITMLNDVLKAAISTEKVLTDGDFDKFYLTLNEKDKEKLFSDLVKKLEVEPMTAPNIKKLKSAMKKAQKELEKNLPEKRTEE